MRARNKIRQKGVVLIAVMWAVFILTAMAFALSAMVRGSGEELHARKEQLQASYVARGAVYRAVSMLKQPMVQNGEPRPFAAGQSRLQWNEAGQRISIDVFDEGGKLDLNAAPPAMLERLFTNLGIDFNAAHSLVAAIEDWRDADDDTRPGGAESLYYLSLPQPYRPANHDFESVDELLLVRGVTPGLLYGGYSIRKDGTAERRLGLIDCLTVSSKVSRVNINYAPLPVLLAVPHMSPETAQMIVEGRARKPFGSVSDFTHDYPVLLDGETLSSLVGGSSGPYTLIASATAEDGITARVRAVVQVTGLDVQTTTYQTESDANGEVRNLPKHETRTGPPFSILQWDDFYVR
jgi:general secretion pathway protein K